MSIIKEAIEIIDLGNNIGRATRALARYDKIMSAVTFWAASFVAALFGVMAWVFDLRPTLLFAGHITTMISPSLPQEATWLLGVVTIVLTLAPTLSEMTVLPAFAREEIKLAKYVVITLLLFDAFSDGPAVAAFVSSAFVPILATHLNGILLSIASFVFFCCWLVASTVAFEFIFVLSLVGTFQLFYQGYMVQEVVSHGAQRQARNNLA